MRRWAAALAGAWLVSSCATYTDKTEAARAAVEVGNLGGGVKEINRYLKVRKSDDLPTKWKKDTALAVLERATILHAMGELELSKRDFQVADEQLVLLDVAGDTAGQIGKYIFSDDATKYKAPPSEKLAL
ncbi:MAG: hypothetical protein KC636_16220, partial [Myxococcales bacterium]|nr:hypothetical protein [Myxococcales bacterium]